MKTSTAPSSAARPFAPSDRKLASPWIRDLKTGAARRECLVSRSTVAFVAPSHAGDGWLSFAGIPDRRDDRESAMLWADLELNLDGWRLIHVPGHELETE